ncbi:TPM domain-containing protein [Danxiaibacter flavus]|uniref:TPM domain-containing protein n=1 Tax=Danxiaibacter flavus TaxID=3049108 RepID=A0ABV3ZMR7_9BACT|nr:TPM domain-containing protein [Chitinophagaceae bacterium DXS]
MRTITIAVFTAMLLLCTMTFAQHVLPKPKPARFVTDKASVLSGDQRSQLEHKLKRLNDATSNQIVVVLIPTLNGAVIEEYANQLFRTWGIGQKKKNNGVLILAAINDHQMRIEIGYGLEGTIPDITAKKIITNDIKPAFKDGQYFTGLDSATNDLARAAVGEYNEPVVANATPVEYVDPDFEEQGGVNLVEAAIYIISFLIAFLILLLNAIKKYPPGRYYGSGNSYSDYGGYYSDSYGDNGSDSGDFGGGDSGGGGASDSW